MLGKYTVSSSTPWRLHLACPYDRTMSALDNRPGDHPVLCPSFSLSRRLQAPQSPEQPWHRIASRAWTWHVKPGAAGPNGAEKVKKPILMAYTVGEFQQKSHRRDSTARESPTFATTSLSFLASTTVAVAPEFLSSSSSWPGHTTVCLEIQPISDLHQNNFAGTHAEIHNIIQCTTCSLSRL